MIVCNLEDFFWGGDSPHPWQIMTVTFICLKMTWNIATIVERQLQNVETIATQVFFYQPDAVSYVRITAIDMDSLRTKTVWNNS